MGKARQKRTRKEIEKLFQTGRFREWFGLVEKEGLQNEYAKEWQDAWKTLARRAFRSPEGLEDFWKHLEEIGSHPDWPDLNLLVLLKRFAEGDEVANEIANIQGLRPQAEPFRAKVLLWREESFPEGAAQKLLTSILRHPEKADERLYVELARLTEDAGISFHLARLGKMIADLRLLNQKGCLSKGLKRPQLQTMQNLDLKLNEMSARISPILSQVLFYPFLIQTARLFQSLLDKNDLTNARQVVSASPFLFSLAAGEKAEEIRTELLGSDPRSLSDNGVFYPAAVAARTDLEEKAALLGKMRILARDHDSEEFVGQFRTLYSDVLAGIAERRKNLPEREARQIPVVMKAFLLDDIDYLWDDIPRRECLLALAAILRRIGEAGCLETRLSLLSLMLAEKFRDKSLRELARNTLAGSSSPVAGDLQWIFNRFDKMVFPHVGILKPVVDRADIQASLLPVMAERMLEQINRYLFMGAFSEGVGKMFPFMDRCLPDDSRADLAALRREILVFKEHSAFRPVIAYADCYPDGVFKQTGYFLFLEYMYDRRNGAEAILDILFDIHRKLDTRLGTVGDDPPFALFEDFLLEQRRLTLIFLQKRTAGLRAVKLERLGDLVAFFSTMKVLFEEDGDLLMVLSNVLSERAKSGEEAAGRLHKELMELLIRFKGKNGRRSK